MLQPNAFAAVPYYAPHQILRDTFAPYLPAPGDGTKDASWPPLACRSGADGSTKPVADRCACVGGYAHSHNFLNIGGEEVFCCLPGVAASDEEIYAGIHAPIHERPNHHRNKHYEVQPIWRGGDCQQSQLRNKWINQRRLKARLGAYFSAFVTCRTVWGEL